MTTWLLRVYRQDGDVMLDIPRPDTDEFVHTIGLTPRSALKLAWRLVAHASRVAVSHD